MPRTEEGGEIRGMLAIDRNVKSCDSGKIFFSALAIQRKGSPAIVRILAPPCLQIRNQLWLLSILIKENSGVFEKEKEQLI